MKQKCRPYNTQNARDRYYLFSQIIENLCISLSTQNTHTYTHTYVYTHMLCGEGKQKVENVQKLLSRIKV